MTWSTSLRGRHALVALAVTTGAALLISCAGTLDDIDKYRDGDSSDGSGGSPPGGGSGAGTPAATTGGSPTATTGGDAATTGGDAATTGGDPATTTASASSGGVEDMCPPSIPAFLTEACAQGGCHDMGGAKAGLVMTAGWETMVVNRGTTSCNGAQLLVPGNPDASAIYTKMLPTPPPQCGIRMPAGQMPISDPDIMCVRDWIMSL
ncbi:hypothetical protein SOCE26_033650 [Sorangium cellulosum]|uniref:Secreted protein n=1 Tax=Sorangium cellulosum TaxID=56 RepID=A0A2L0ERP7_SORCE|nr:hypothetical protein [Sorangium cellulosum]AUX41940.1 hypothetical protein SOCE26_033650 [Sorangium cellulosum]